MMTPVERTLHDLEHFEPQGAKVLSLYLATDPSVPLGRKLHAQIKDLARGLQANADPGSHPSERLHREFMVAEQAATALATPPRALAVFTCAEREFVRMVHLPTRLAPMAFWGPEPYLRPLQAALDEFQRVLVVLIDKERTRLFRVFMQQIVELDDLIEATPGRHRQFGGTWAYPSSPDWSRGGWSDSGIVRHEEMHVRHHVAQTVAAIRHVIVQEHIDRILVGGTPEAVAEFRRLLPKSLRAHISANEVHVPLFASTPDVLTAVDGVIADIERAEEARLLDELAERDGWGRSVFGAAATAAAASEDNVQLLIYGADTWTDGHRCVACGRLFASPAPSACPACGGEMRRIIDLAAHLASRVVTSGGRVEEVRGTAADRLAVLGGLAAVLRHPPMQIVVAPNANGVRTGRAGE